MTDKRNLQKLLIRIATIRAEPNTERRLNLLLQLNDSLPENIKLAMPSLITNAYVRRALDIIEERMILAA